MRKHGNQLLGVPHLEKKRMKQHTPRFLKVVQMAKQNISETDIHTVKKKLAAGDHFYLLDVREQNEWQAGHLPQAKHLSKGVIERDIEKLISDETAEIILYCGGGFRSALVADNLQKMGYKNVLSMDGGFSAWKEAGFPLTQD